MVISIASFSQNKFFNRYAVGGVVSSSLSFRFTAIRTDKLRGWTEQPTLLWNALGLEVPPAKGRGNNVLFARYCPFERFTVGHICETLVLIC